MKKYLLIISFFLCCLSCFAQSISYQNFMKIVTDDHWASINETFTKLKFDLVGASTDSLTSEKVAYWTYNCKNTKLEGTFFGWSPAGEKYGIFEIHENANNKRWYSYAIYNDDIQYYSFLNKVKQSNFVFVDDFMEGKHIITRYKKQIQDSENIEMFIFYSKPYFGSNRTKYTIFYFQNVNVLKLPSITEMNADTFFDFLD